MKKLYINFSRIVYTFLYYLVLPGILVRLLWRSRHSVGYRQRWSERFGFIKRPHDDKDSIWVHAVSVGEAMAAIPLVKALHQRYANYNIIVTTTTPTGSDQVIKNLKAHSIHYYSPYDIPSVVNRFLRRSQTKLCVIMETELWPNMLSCCKKQNIPILLANARMSERSKHKYKLISGMTKFMLSTYSMVAAQGILDGERLIELGLNPNRLMISGNIKFDIQLPTSLIESGKKLREEWQSCHRPTFIAASTHEGEEKIILEAFKKIRKQLPNTLLVLVPRHTNRFSKVGKLCESTGYKVAYRSLKQAPKDEADILLGDTIGELRLIYAACDIAFVGGSLVPIGGHNLIEPAALSLPILTGPYLQNFNEIGKTLKDAGAAQIINDADSLSDAVVALYTAQELRDKMGQRAYEVVSSNRGALEKHLKWIDKTLPCRDS